MERIFCVVEHDGHGRELGRTKGGLTLLEALEMANRLRKQRGLECYIEETRSVFHLRVTVGDR